MRKLILFLLVFASAKVSAQVYQLMPQYGYQAPRFAIDSTLQIPTVCGVPTLKSVQFVTKKGAIAYDSCNAKFYTYNPKTQIWSEVSGGGATDTTSLSNRINLKLNIADTSAMLNPYLRKIDTTNKFVNRITRTEGKDSIIYFVGANRFAIKDSVGGGAGSDTAKVVIAQVHNETATTLLKGEVVYLFGSNGNVASVKRANNKTDATSSKTFGIVRRDIVAGGTGFVTTQGQIEKLNLGSYVEGDVLWLDSLDGQFTKVKPQAPYHSVFIGVVERANNGNGLAYVKPQNGVELDEVHDVQINSILNNQILVYSDTQSVWKNRNINSLIDTTLFQRKSLSANTIMANNTSATANATAQIFKQFGNQTYSDSITITGASNPSGAINHSFRWSQIGNLVTLHITLTYATVGSLSQVAIEIPDGLPAPILPTGLTANNDIIAYGTGFMVTNTTGVASVFSKVFLRQNTGLTNDYEVVINQATNASYRIFNATIQYFAQ